MYNFDEELVRFELEKLIDPDAKIRMPFPFKDITGPQSFFNSCYTPLIDAFPDLERRDWIVMGGETEQSNHWVGCGGHYTGTFVALGLIFQQLGILRTCGFMNSLGLKKKKLWRSKHYGTSPSL